MENNDRPLAVGDKVIFENFGNKHFAEITEIDHYSTPGTPQYRIAIPRPPADFWWTQDERLSHVTDTTATVERLRECRDLLIRLGVLNFDDEVSLNLSNECLRIIDGIIGEKADANT